MNTNDTRAEVLRLIEEGIADDQIGEYDCASNPDEQYDGPHAKRYRALRSLIQPQGLAWELRDTKLTRALRVVEHDAKYEMSPFVRDLIGRAADALEREGPAWASETGWLIERVTKTGPLWLTDDHEAPRQFSWTHDANDAIRFSREQDATSVMACCHLLHGVFQDGEPARVFVSEHKWTPSPPTQEPR